MTRQRSKRETSGAAETDEARAQPIQPLDPGSATLERVEERVVADVRPVEAGSVRIDKRVVEEEDTVEVTLRHDELDLERRRVNRRLEPDEQPIREIGDTTVLLVVEERLEVRRVPYVVEEIHLRRRVVTERQEVSDTVRKERWDIRPEGGVDVEQR
jgi:uncharacterized protein (TIGR02271 family)